MLPRSAGEVESGLEELTVVKHEAMNMSDEPCGYYPAKP